MDHIVSFLFRHLHFIGVICERYLHYLKSQVFHQLYNKYNLLTQTRVTYSSTFYWLYSVPTLKNRSNILAYDTCLTRHCKQVARGGTKYE